MGATIARGLGAIREGQGEGTKTGRFGRTGLGFGHTTAAASLASVSRCRMHAS